MFNKVYTRVMAAAAAVMASVGMRRYEPVAQAPHRAYNPARAASPPIPTFVPAFGRSVGGALSWGKWRYPRQEGELARRRRQIEAGTLTISNGLVCLGVRYLGHGRVERVSIA